MKRSSREVGFTLLEVMIVLSIGAIILTMAVPSFTTMMANNLASTETNNLVTSLNLARSESVKRGINVSLCSRASPRTSPETCADNTNWADGWLMFTDDSGTAGDFDGTDTLIRAKDGLTSTGVLTANANNVQYLPNGMAQAPVSLTVRLTPCHNQEERAVSIARSGRISSTTNNCSS